ncbi:hypothetical protein N9W79_00805 [bacterium]|nr:hypothetical protein [bacterium]
MQNNFIFGLLIVGLTSCGIEGIDITKVDKEDGETRALTPINVPVQLTDMSGSLSLAAATTFDISLENCVSGFTATASELTVGGLDVYKFDQSCLAKLQEFETGGTVYRFDNPGAVGFTTWLAGDNATFTDAGGTLSIGVSVITQLDDPVSGTEAIEYGFSIALAGTGQTIADTTVGASHTMTVGSDDAPDVEIEVGSLTTSFVGMTATGAGQFVFDLECGAAIAGNLCSGVDMTVWEVVLVEDTYGGSPSLTNLNALFPGNAVVTVSGGIGTNGGFTSPTLTGPAAMHTKPNMLLVVKNGLSYKFFDVDITTLAAVQ